MEASPGLEPALLALGRRTDMIPRDTVFHYTEWNPDGVRRRAYTGESQEIFLRDATRMTLSHLADAVLLCEQLSDAELDGVETPRLLNALAAALDAFDVSMRMVADEVSPGFFAEVLRPYFQEIQVGGEKYLGPAASHVPLFLIDLALWASDHSADHYTGFRQDSARYALPRWRALARAWEEAPSFTTRLDAALTAGRPGVADRFQATVEAFGVVMRTLIRFRGKHLTFARKTYTADTCAYEAGSGGGTVDFLQQILGLTRRVIPQ
ncbi:monodechloroaminopyrrolnitrin synthase PrnB family protein [Streptomyces sp. B93]|uniref:monodechloroaminopyrrolnitrin synthase PrnB family protein n=1 Tax=Streptomyces sp. B93 TaxID=2824875 RepID=UPI0027E409A5|nr:monodechloroaminopyrrolnitrin synthase PrnB family protein [Streptomyces sp. B93]